MVGLTLNQVTCTEVLLFSVLCNSTSSVTPVSFIHSPVSERWVIFGVSASINSTALTFLVHASWNTRESLRDKSRWTRVHTISIRGLLPSDLLRVWASLRPHEHGRAPTQGHTHQDLGWPDLRAL